MKCTQLIANVPRLIGPTYIAGPRESNNASMVRLAVQYRMTSPIETFKDVWKEGFRCFVFGNCIAVEQYRQVRGVGWKLAPTSGLYSLK